MISVWRGNGGKWQKKMENENDRNERCQRRRKRRMIRKDMGKCVEKMIIKRSRWWRWQYRKEEWVENEDIKEKMDKGEKRNRITKKTKREK